ncbi:hypothetical protein [Acinetobacter sp.]|uniref:hypothetical protein n=1 Tax=Acinetobacter sp. TaxID=472 RepID=UPI00264998EC|nr:hypothetical protein [Acinetobacter sp.]MDN5511158.1 hypothetical protein [Acinetobacter sp.]MDN5523949.1 hypothetical protein [Acinetobacter sp.]
METLPEELYEYALHTCDYGEPRNYNYKFIKAFDSHQDALNYADEVLGLKKDHENYEFEIIKNLNTKKIKTLYEKSDYLRYKTERQELINQIKLLSSDPSVLEHLEDKTITELMRIYYAGFDNHCARCGDEVKILSFKSIYRSNAS